MRGGINSEGGMRLIGPWLWVLGTLTTPSALLAYALLKSCRSVPSFPPKKEISRGLPWCGRHSGSSVKDLLIAPCLFIHDPARQARGPGHLRGRRSVVRSERGDTACGLGTIAFITTTSPPNRSSQFWSDSCAVCLIL